jgi:hypothetical protein
VGLRPATGYLAAGFPSAGKPARSSRGKDGNRDAKTYFARAEFDQWIHTEIERRGKVIRTQKITLE